MKHATAPLRVLALAAACAAVLSSQAGAEEVTPGEEAITSVLARGVAAPRTAPPRGDESEGPFERLVIENAFLVDGTGAPPRGPVNIVIEGDRIADIKGGGTAGIHGGSNDWGPGSRVIDASGQYVLPGLIDAHAHLGTPSHAPAGSLTDPEYVLKLWLAHGVTTVRDVGAMMGLGWTLDHKKRSASGEISAPRMVVHSMFPEAMESPDAARKWVRAVRKRGADGIKFLGAAPDLIEAAMDEARELGMKTAYHHSQLSVTGTNVLDSARMGLDSMEHWYGLPEAMFEERVIQDYPYDYNYSNEQDRFGQAGRLWLQAAPPGSERWQATIDELISLDFTLDPTFTIYEAARDVMRARHAPWHDEYTMPYIARAFEPSPEVHGSFFFDWTTADEVAWKRNYQRWMTFVNDYKNAGGRVTVGSDAGFIYKIYGFAYVRELELLQEAGFHPLEVLKSATLNGAELLGMEDEIGSVEIGKRADLVIVNENPVANFKVLYGTGHLKLDEQSHTLERTEGIRYVIRDGIVFDKDKLLEDVRELVAAQKAAEAGA
ncbi:amidohydrolase family protein [Parahaliea maris]|uniref:Amidohydrolase family protein n=1 Tax=Parahaliea maris TaxID=2716870 RepID=A0A5C9A226_9GAMM|nr:amidohydrolase family protein [Parahaliea maris]TXS94119.1 amidohydrolase family protein [Parahaliea maris]